MLKSCCSRYMLSGTYLLAPLREDANMKQYPWSEVYRIALLELDRSKVPERIAIARQTLKARMQAIPLCASAEQQAIEDALNALRSVETTEQIREVGT